MEKSTGFTLPEIGTEGNKLIFQLSPFSGGVKKLKNHHNA
jgi:hypothetical protein